MHDIKHAHEEKVVLAGIRSPRMSEREWNLSWAELRGLVETVGGEIVSEIIQNRELGNSTTVLGSGKTEELAAVCKQLEADTVVFGTELSPTQVRTLETLLPCRVIDRTQVILDIFADRARSHEGKLQVELAQLGYLLPRLTGRGAALSRLGGGIGTRGPGETKLETDRRHIRGRMNELRHHIKQIENVRTNQRRARKRMNTPQIALVGYTNAGKTSLLRALTRLKGTRSEEIQGRNRLFDTLDPTSRKIDLGIGKEVVLTDTVGFIQNLPHTLVDAFRSTLEETIEADLLLHVVDASHPDAGTQMETVYQVLEEIGWLDCPVISVYNKSDLCPNVAMLPDPKAVVSIQTSTETGDGLHRLLEEITQVLTSDYIQMQLLIPFSTGDLLSRLYRECYVLKRQDQEEGISLQVKVPPEWVSLFEPYQLFIR